MKLLAKEEEMQKALAAAEADWGQQMEARAAEWADKLHTQQTTDEAKRQVERGAGGES